MNNNKPKEGIYIHTQTGGKLQCEVKIFMMTKQACLYIYLQIIGDICAPLYTFMTSQDYKDCLSESR